MTRGGGPFILADILRLFALIIGVNAAIWAIIIPLTKRSYARASKLMQNDLAASGEAVIQGPVSSWYQGRTDKFDITGGAIVALTERRLIIRKITREVIEVSASDIVAVRVDKWFMGKFRNNRYHVVVKTAANTEFGFQVPNYTDWVAAFERLISSKS